MRRVFQPWAIFIVALKRMLSQYGLTLATLFGIVAATSLTMSIPLYADAVYHRLFRENVHVGGGNEGEETAPRPPLEFLFAYEGSSYGVKQWEDIQSIDNYLTKQVNSILEIPQKLFVRFLTTDTFQLFPKVENGAMSAQDRLDWVSFATASDIQRHILLLEGSVPDDLETTGSIVDVLISERMALEKGFQVGDTYVVLSQASSSDNAKTVVQLDVRIAGVWRAEQPEDRYWFFGPEFLEQRFLVLEETFGDQIGPEMPNEIYLAIWYMVLDDSSVRYQDIAPLIKRISVLEREAEVLMPGIQSAISPIQALEAYHSNATRLTVQLYALNLPILSLIFAFIALTAGLSANQRRNEIAVLRSRGAQTSQIVGFVVLENLVLGVIGFLLSVPASLAISHLIGQARHFLDFSSPSDLPLDQTGAALQIGLASIVVAIFFNVILSLNAAQGTVITYRQERSRMVQKPWWQRAWLDLLLLIPVILTIYLVRQQGTIDFYGGQGPMQNALFFLLPALIILSLTLFLLRLIPIVMGFIAKVTAWTPSLGLLMATRYLSRTPKFYNIPMLLLVLTLSLSAFFSSLAGTMDQHVHDLVYYRVGSDLRFLDRGENMNEGGLFSGFGTGGGIQQRESTDPRWVFLPVSEYLELPDTQAAVRVGRYPVEIFWGENIQEGLFLGVDRFDFPGVAYWRQDFAPASLGALMNKLALAQEGILVPSTVMGQHGLDIGDALRFRVYTYGIETEMEMRVVGVFDLFPTWYPDQGPLLVGDLDDLFEQVGGAFPYQVWLKTNSNFEIRNFENRTARTLNLHSIQWEFAPTEIAETELRPERQGVFGSLSVGFAAASLFTVLGFTLYALSSFQSRYAEFGVLRASGLSIGQMVSFLAWELGFLILIGCAIGTGLGVITSQVIIPYLQFGRTIAELTPPYLVLVSWNSILRIYVLFGLLFFTALALLIGLLLRMKIFQAIKMGETV